MFIFFDENEMRWYLDLATKKIYVKITLSFVGCAHCSIENVL